MIQASRAVLYDPHYYPKKREKVGRGRPSFRVSDAEEDEHSQHSQGAAPLIELSSQALFLLQEKASN